MNGKLVAALARGPSWRSGASRASQACCPSGVTASPSKPKFERRPGLPSLSLNA